MARSKMNFKDTIHGFKSIACRNSILIMVIVSFDSFSINMKNAVSTLIGLNSAGLSPTAVSTLGSVFTLVGFLIRTPAASLAPRGVNSRTYSSPPSASAYSPTSSGAMYPAPTQFTPD